MKRMGFSSLLLLALLLGSAVYPAGATSTAPAQAAETGLGGPHIMPFNSGRPRAASAPAGAHLTYFGGRVLTNVKVVQVIYGSGTYLPQTTSNVTPSVSSFFAGITNSPYFDWLTEYNTNLTSQSVRTNQTIGRGTFGARVTITPSAANNGSQIQDSNVQAELQAQITAHNLPQPALDSAGNTNTLYEIFFRRGQSICMGSTCSLVAGGFCAYHGTIAAGSLPELYYSVEPDLTGVSGCGTGTDFENTTSVASHEMIETVTDGEVSLANSNGPPLAWYDATNGEIGDICNGQQGTVTGGDGIAYTVQKQFSNVANDCILTRGIVANDFSISANPNSLSIAQNATGTSTINTATTGGSPQTVSLGLSGLPQGASAALNPASITSGASSTLTIQAGSAAPGTYALTITGTGASATHTTTISLTVLGPSVAGITNGGFESGLAGWTSTGTTANSTTAHSGASSGMAGAATPTNGDSTLAQTFTAPTGAAALSLWYKMTCPDTITYDWASVTLKDNTSGTTATPVARFCTTNATWVQATAAVTAGDNYTLTLLSHDDNYVGDPTFTLFDDVALAAGGPPPPPPPPSGITNGTFESGLTGWTATGASTTTVSSGCHSGSSCAQLGSTSPTNGDSNLAQTFTAPTGSTRLTFWYKMTCPDTITYDWATVSLRDTTAGTTSTPLAKTCTSNAWTSVTVTISAGHSYTLTLTSHDDNYAGDPTFTLFDDVATG
ncbi:MAG: Peptidase propeptide [Actinobacteria bacterium]|nr:Peptidase propeptide [Actinomycetota bacterium]